MSDEDGTTDKKVIDLEEYKASLCEDCEQGFEEFVYSYLGQLNDVVDQIQKNQAEQLNMIINLQKNMSHLIKGEDLEILETKEVSDDLHMR